PVLALRGGDPAHREIGPVHSPHPAPRVEWLTTVPAAFPLADGSPEPTRAAARPDAAMTPTCRPWQLQAADSKVGHHPGESEDRSKRMLLLFPDPAQASGQMEALRDATAGCGDGRFVYTPVEVAASPGEADETYAWAQQVDMGGGLLSDLTL